MLKNLFSRLRPDAGGRAPSRLRARAVAAAAAFSLAVCAMAGCADLSWLESEPPYPVDSDRLVSEALLEQAESDRVPDAECVSEGHLIMAKEYRSGVLTVYALVQTGGYGFLNGNFVQVSGLGPTPAVFTFAIPKKDAVEGQQEGSLATPKLLKVEYPRDGAEYADSVREMIPAGYVKRALEPTDADRELMDERQEAYARTYLDSIGRSADVGRYGDFPVTLLTDLGVPVEVSNKISENETGLFDGWPLGVGTRELVIDGERHVFEMAYERGDEFVTFTHTLYDTGEVIERFYVEVATGDIMME